MTTPTRIGHWQGLFFLMFGLSPIIGQGLALLLTGPVGLSGRTIFTIMFVVSWSGVALFLAVRPRPAYLPALEPRPPRPLRAVLPSLVAAARQMWRLWPLYLVSGLTSPYYNGYLAGRLRLSLTIQSLLLAGIGAVGGGFVFSHLSDLVCRRRIIHIILALQLTASVLTIVAVHLGGATGKDDPAPPVTAPDALLRLAFLLNGLCDGGFNTQTRAATAVAYPALKEEASAVLLLLSSLGSATGFLYGSHLPQAAQVAVILTMAALAAVACVFVPVNAQKSSPPLADLSHFALAPADVENDEMLVIDGDVTETVDV
jgi:hypothetical protein